MFTQTFLSILDIVSLETLFNFTATTSGEILQEAWSQTTVGAWHLAVAALSVGAWHLAVAALSVLSLPTLVRDSLGYTGAC